MADPLALLDRAVGNAVEAATAAHHRRRLTRHGHAASLDPPQAGELWAAGEPRPRPGNRLDVLIDGEEVLGALVPAIQGAREHVHLAGWCMSPDFAVRRGEHPLCLRELLAETADRVPVRVLLWAGAPAKAFSPSRKAVRAIRDELQRDGEVRVALDAHERPMHCHHEKLAVIDGRVAFVGGLDLTDLGGDRFDDPVHPARGRLGWHDVATRIEGPAVADVAQHLADRWHAVTGDRLAVGPPPPPAGEHELQIVRTVPEGLYPFVPQGDFRIVETYVRMLRSAQRLVYLENQFLWAPEVVTILADKLRDPPHPDFRIVVVLPGRANNGEDDTRGQIAVLLDADDGGGRFLATTVSAVTGRRADPVYVHAKVAVVDDRMLTIGSANINAHSFFNDSECNVVCHDPELARATRLRLWGEHLRRPADELEGPAHEVVDGLWRPIAREQRRLVDAGHARTHPLLELLPGSRRWDRLAGPLQGLLVDG